MGHLIWYPGHEKLLETIVRAENCGVYDADGRRYVDLESGVWCTSVGHAHPRLLRVMADQAGRLAHTGFCYSSGVVEEAAQEMLALHGFEGGGCTFLCSGSEAVEYGVRVARALSERPLFITLSDSYFGAYGSASSRDPNAWVAFDWSACDRCVRSGPCDDSCDAWRGIPFDRIGGFLFEPGSSSGFVRFPPARFVEGLAKTVQKNGGLLMVNEVTTGIGRTGRWFGYQHYGVTPDIVAMGKGIGNGYPVSVAAIAPGVMARMTEDPIAYTQSHQNDPLGAAIALEVVRIITEGDLVTQSNALATLLVEGLAAIGKKTDRIAAIRSRGLMVAVDLRDDPGAPFTTTIHRNLAKKGYLLARRPGMSTLRIDPSLTIGQEDLLGFLAALDGLLSE